MENETLRSRIAQLVQKSRKAGRLYVGFEKMSEGEQSEYTGLQLEQWQQINGELQRLLAVALDKPNQKGLGTELYHIRDRFYSEWRRAEADVRLSQVELLTASEKGDFIKAAMTARSLVSLRAREQAAQAAHHELHDVLLKCRIPAPPSLNNAQASLNNASASNKNAPAVPAGNGESFNHSLGYPVSGLPASRSPSSDRNMIENIPLGDEELADRNASDTSGCTPVTPAADQVSASPRRAKVIPLRNRQG